MSKRFSIIWISIILISFFILPAIVLAQNSNWPLKGKETENLLNIIRSEPLIQANFDLFNNAFIDKPDAARKTGAVVLVKRAILKKQLDYWFKEIPKELSIKFIKTALKVVRIVYAQDIGTLLETIEQISVEKATEYATNWFLQNEIKIGTGEMSYTYLSYKGNSQKIDIQYIIVYHPTGSSQGKVIVEFYSKNTIEPPIGTDPWGCPDSIFDHPKVICFPWDRWLENERKRDNDGKLEPFIVRVKGYIMRDSWGNFQWDKSKGKPIVEVDFDNPVPEIENSDIILETGEIEAKWNFFKEKIIDPLAEKLNGAKDITIDSIEKITDYFSSLWLEATIGGPAGEQRVASRKDIIESELIKLFTKLREEILSFQKSIESEKNKSLEEAQEILEKSQLTLEELIERFDDISEEAEIVLAQAEEFLPEETISRIKQNGIQETPEKDTQKEPFEEIREEVQEEIEGNLEQTEEVSEEISEKVIICPLSNIRYPARDKIIFNEIAWMGTTNSPNDEWFELKNISRNPVDLNGWQILDKATVENKSGGIKILFENASLEPGGFFLLERTDNSTVPNISADLIYTGILRNNDEALYLFDQNCYLQDKVEALPDWPAGNNSSKKTMERKNDFGWQTSQNVGGTPKMENSSGEAVFTIGGGTGGETGGSGASPSAQSQPEITLSYLQNVPVNKEIEVVLSLSNLKNTSYDAKISIENETTTLSEIFNQRINNWQSSYKYVTSTFSGTSFSGNFRLRIKISENSFRGEANIIAKIRETEKSSIYLEFNGKINIIDPEQKQNQLPAAAFTFSPQNPFVGDSILFDASSSTDPDGQIVSYTWNFGDGTTTTIAEATTTHSFSTYGEFQITLVVTDNKGTTGIPATTTLKITKKSLPKSKLAQSVVISEVQIEDKEFVELYNPTDQLVSMAGWFLSYFPKNKDWNKPHGNWQFPATSSIGAKSYYLIGIYEYPEKDGNPDADWQVLTKGKNPHPYKKGQFAKDAGAIGIFSSDPSASTTEVAKNCKIDVVGWGEVEVKEENSAPESDEGKSLTRKQDENGNYIENNDNSIDFEIRNPTPTNSKGKTGNISPPEPVQNFQVASSTDNIVTLTWSISTDPDTPQENIFYTLYYSRYIKVTEENAKPGTLYISSTSTTSTVLTISNLDYDAKYYFGIRASDGLYYTSLATTTHFTPLPRISDLNAGTSANRETIDIFWTSPGGKKYLIKYAEKEIVESGASDNQINWENATSVENPIIPKAKGKIEILTLENLIPNKNYYFAIKSINSADATSAISNSDKAKTLPGFRDNNDGTISDLYTGLMWLKNGASLGANNGEPLTWEEAKDFCDNLILCNDGTFVTSSFVTNSLVTSSQVTSTCAENGGIKYDDWRLPNYKELASIINYRKSSPAAYENYFVNTISDIYWTTSYKFVPAIPYVSGPSWEIRIIDFNSGAIKITTRKNENHYILPVRGPDTQDVLPISGISGSTSGCNLGLENNEDGTVTDLCTGLMWSESNITGIGYRPGGHPWHPPGSEIGVSWGKAIEVAANSTIAGYNDWRLPNVRELLSIAGISSGKNHQWSSTPDYSNPNNRWFVSLLDNPGISDTASEEMEYYVRLVRDSN